MIWTSERQDSNLRPPKFAVVERQRLGHKPFGIFSPIGSEGYVSLRLSHSRTFTRYPAPEHGHQSPRSTSSSPSVAILASVIATHPLSNGGTIA